MIMMTEKRDQVNSTLSVHLDIESSRYTILHSVFLKIAYATWAFKLSFTHMLHNILFCMIR